MTSAPDPDAELRELREQHEQLRASLRSAQSSNVEEWVRLIRFGEVVPRSIEESLSWKVTRPVRLAQTAVRVLRRDGARTFLATARGRLVRGK